MLEHISDDEKMLAQINRMMKRNAHLFLSVPINMRHWTNWDAVVGHYRRYSPEKLQKVLKKNGFELECYAEDTVFSAVYSNAFGQKIAGRFFKLFPQLSVRIETLLLKLLCRFARRFSAMEWRQGELDTVGEKTRGIYLICKKAR